MTGDHFHLHDVAWMPRAARPRIGKICRHIQGRAHSARAAARELFALDVARRHEAGAGGFGKNSNRVVKVGRSAKAAVPPGVVKRVRQYAFETRGSNVGGHLVADQADLSQQERRDARVWRIVEWRYKESRSVRALLMNVIDDFRKPFFPKQTSDGFRL